MRRSSYIFILCVLVSKTYAQIPEKLSIGIHTGFSYTGIAFRGLDNLSRNTSADALYDLHTRAPISVSVDLKPNDRFSIGLLLSNQKFSGSINGYTFNYLNDSVVIEDVDLVLKRYYIGVAPKYYWKKNNDRIKCYSSLRIGYVLWRNDISSSDQSFELPQWLGFSRPSLGLIPLGCDLFITDNIAFNFETALAAPHVFRVGFQYGL